MARRIATTREHHRDGRPLLGLRRTPGRLALAVFRMPLRLYEGCWGWMLGRTFLQLVHVGRTTGQPHSTVAMVLADNRATGEVAICSGWGPAADWLRNLHARRAQEVCIGRERFVPDHRFLTEDEAFAVGVEFRRQHPWRLWLVSKILGWGDLRRDDAIRDFVRHHPFVALRPTQTITTHRSETGR
jgi:deazaflavin-dependent oxidoreductase (nitroreductase family)